MKSHNKRYFVSIFDNVFLPNLRKFERSFPMLPNFQNWSITFENMRKDGVFFFLLLKSGALPSIVFFILFNFIGGLAQYLSNKPSRHQNYPLSSHVSQWSEIVLWCFNIQNSNFVVKNLFFRFSVLLYIYSWFYFVWSKFPANIKIEEINVASYSWIRWIKGFTLEMLGW